MSDINRFKTGDHENVNETSSKPLSNASALNNEIVSVSPRNDMKNDGSSVRKTFPSKLYEILSSPDADASIISWLPHGMAWKVHDSERFEKEIIPKHFKQTKFSSFTRQVNGWGFKRICKGEDKGGFYHTLFIKDKPELMRQIRRVKKADAIDPFYTLNRGLHENNVEQRPHNSAMLIHSRHINSGSTAIVDNPSLSQRHLISSYGHSGSFPSSLVVGERARNNTLSSFRPNVLSSEVSPYLLERQQRLLLGNNNLASDQAMQNIGSSIIPNYERQLGIENFRDSSFALGNRNLNAAVGNPLLPAVSDIQQCTTTSLRLPMNASQKHLMNNEPQSSGYLNRATMVPSQQQLVLSSTTASRMNHSIAHLQERNQQLHQELHQQPDYLPPSQQDRWLSRNRSP